MPRLSAQITRVIRLRRRPPQRIFRMRRQQRQSLSTASPPMMCLARQKRAAQSMSLVPLVEMRRLVIALVSPSMARTTVVLFKQAIPIASRWRDRIWPPTPASMSQYRAATDRVIPSLPQAHQHTRLMPLRPQRLLSIASPQMMLLTLPKPEPQLMSLARSVAMPLLVTPLVLLLMARITVALSKQVIPIVSR